MEDSQFQGRDSDPYAVLGVPADASRQDIVRAYRRAAQLAHPDARPQDPQAAARFGVLSDAYQTLSDPGRRADYDRAHPTRRGRQATTPDAGISAQHGSTVWAPGDPPLWAGPVHVQPARAPFPEQTQSPGRAQSPGQTESAEPAQSAEPGRSAETHPGNAGPGLVHHRDPDVYIGLRPPRTGSAPW